jgi:hypothetical protein
MRHHTDECRSVELTSDGHWLLTGSFDGQAAVVNAASASAASSAQQPQVVKNFDAHDGGRIVSTQWHPKKVFAVLIFLTEIVLTVLTFYRARSHCD